MASPLSFATRYEGHPLLFHLLLQTLGHLSRSWWSVVALHVAIACAAAWVILRYSPFTKLERVMVIAGYFFMYEYAVIVRPYSLALLFAFGACAAWTARRRRPMLAIVLLVLLANTTAIGLVVALAAGGAFVLDLVWRDDAPLRLSGRQVAIAAAAIACIALLGIVRVMQLMPPADAAYRGEGVLAGNRSLWYVGSVLTTPLRALTPIARIGDGTVQWNNWLFKPTGPSALAAQLALSLLILGLGCLVTLRRRAALALYLAGTLGLIAFFTLALLGYARHHGHFVIVWIMAVWLSRAGPATRWPAALQRLADRTRKLAPRLFVVSLVPMLIASAEFIGGDALLQFSDARRVAGMLHARGLDTLPLLGVSRSDAQSVAALLDRPMIDPIDRRSETFLVWGSVADRSPSRAQVDAISDSLFRTHCEIAVISTRQMDVPDTLSPDLRMIYESPVRPMSANWFRVWLRTAPPSARCRRPLH